jgi:hypothetical protein
VIRTILFVNRLIAFAPAIWPLILFTESLDVGLAVRIEEFLTALLPRRLEFGRRDVPVRSASPGDGPQVLAEIFHGRPAKEPVAVVDLVDDETGLEDDHVGDHRIVQRSGVFGDIKIFLDDATHVGEEGPVGADSASFVSVILSVLIVTRRQ